MPFNLRIRIWAPHLFDSFHRLQLHYRLAIEMEGVKFGWSKSSQTQKSPEPAEGFRALNYLAAATGAGVVFAAASAVTTLARLRSMVSLGT